MQGVSQLFETFVISSTAILMIRDDINFARYHIYFVVKEITKALYRGVHFC